MLVTKSRTWWNAKKGDVNKQVLPYVSTVENYQAELFDKFLKLESTYDVNPRTNRNTSEGRVRALGRAKAVITENLIATNVDTVAANVSDSNLSIRIQTDGADWSHQRTAKRLEKYTNGLMKLFEVVEKCQTGFKSGAALKGTGVNKVWIDQFDRINVTPVPIDNIVVDELECRDGKPKQLHYRDFYDKEDLQAQFPDHAEAISRAQTNGNWRVWAGYRPMQSHEVVVIESWRLPIGPYGHDRYIPGRHTLCIDGVDLLDEEYDKDHYPFSKMVWNAPVWGFYGISLAERILPHQNLMNRRNYQVNASLDKKADPITYVNQADQHLAVKTVNQIGSIAVYKAAIPTTVDHQAVGKETYDSIGQIRASAQNETGVNQMMASGAVEGGIESGVGVREARTTHSQRFSIQERAYEKFVQDTMWLVLECCHELGGTKAPDILKVSKYGNRRIKWTEVDLEDLKIEMTVASATSSDPAGRQQRVTELSQAGIITLDESRELIAHPDIDRILSLYNAMIEDIEYTIERILDGAQGVVPEPFQNLDAGMKLMQKEYLLIKSEAPEEILEALADWVAIAANTLNPPPPPQPPGQPGMPPVGPGGPQMPPGMPPGLPTGPAAQMSAAGPAFAPGSYAPMTA